MDLPPTRPKVNTVNIILLGDAGVGKSSIIKMYTERKFEEEHVATLGLDFTARKFEYKNETYTVKLWDTAGSERFQTLTYSFYKRADGIILVYDSSDERTFKSMN